MRPATLIQRLACALALLTLQVQAEEQGGWLQWPDWFAEQAPLLVTVNDAYLEMRTGPGRGFPVFHVVEKGEQITLLKKRTDWVKLEARRGQQGWVRRTDLALTLGPDQQPVTLLAADRELYTDHDWELGLTMGQFDTADSLTFYAGYRFTPNLQLGLSVGQATSTVADNQLYYLRLQHQPWPHWRVSPFFELGAGQINSSKLSALDEPLDASDNSLLIAAGVNIYLTRSFMARLEYDNHKILTSRDENEEVNEWKIGFNVFF